MLSLLIPTYNYYTLPLATSLVKEAEEAGIIFELLVGDDASERYVKENLAINKLPHARFIQQKKNQGRAKIRNYLISMATYDSILLLDCDAEPSPNFIRNYLPLLPCQGVACGGTIYDKSRNSEESSLRYLYGTQREMLSAEQRIKKGYKAFSTFNLLAQRSVLIQNPFEEQIDKYGYEDTLLGALLCKKGVPLTHIDNPLYHNGLDPNKVFLDKIEKSIDTLVQLYQEVITDSSLYRYFKIIEAYRKLRYIAPAWLIAGVFKLAEPYFRRNLASATPSLLILDLFKLGLFAYKLRHSSR